MTIPIPPDTTPLPQGPSVSAAAREEWSDLAHALFQARQTHLPKRLGGPGPTPEQLAQILDAAAHAPDHGQLLPWRFVLVPAASRPLLAEAFARALIERDPGATADQCDQAREKAARAPVLLLAIVEAGSDDACISLAERCASAGCALQNMLLACTAQGYGSALTSGKALQSKALRSLFRLGPTEQALCFVSMGSVLSRKAPRVRPATASYVATLDAERGVLPGWSGAGAQGLH